jgi:glucose/arabinose dehydrogenase
VAIRTPRIRAVGVIATLSLAVAGCTFGPPTDGDGGGPPNLPTPTPRTSTDEGPPSVVATVIAEDLDVPWAIGFLPDGSALVTERDTRRIVKLGPEQGPDGLVVTPVQVIEEADSRGEGGLLGLAVSPDYVTDETIFIYYTTGSDNRIARLTLGGEPEPIVTGIPDSAVHNGGRLRFGPDGFLYASTGDGSIPGLAQDLASLGGKVLRMTRDGEAAPGNPFPDSLVWSYGHRNVQGFAWDAQQHMFATEFGRNTWDEINVIGPGLNYGWPEQEGSGGRDGFVDPIQQWPTSESSCSGMAVTGRVLIVACLRGERLWLVRTTESTTVLGAPTAAVVGTYGRLREAIVAPDGSVWVSTSNRDGRGQPQAGDDKILRIVVAGGGGGVSKA